MLAVAACTRLTLGDGQHRFHRDDHARLQHRVDVLAQFQTGFAAVVMRQDPERVAIAEGAVLQHLLLFEEGVQLVGHLGTRDAGLEQAHAIFMGGDVDVPDAAAGRITFLDEHRAFEGGVIARDHREGVE